MRVGGAGAETEVLSTRGLEVMLAVLAILWIPFALYLVLPSNAAPNVKTTTILSSGPAGGVYQLTLMEIMDTRWNSTLAQPRIFVMGTDGMVPAETISPPTHTTVQLTVVSYDSPTPGSTAQMGKVNGTVGGDVFLINGTSAMGNDPTQDWGRNTTSVPGATLAHTITISQLGINIPVLGGDTTVAYLYFDKAGTYTWYCATPCGFGPTGMDGAMTKTGWMVGQFVVH